MVRKIGNKLTFIFLALTLAIGALGQNSQTVTAIASRSTVGLNETFRITFRAEGRGIEIMPPKFDHFIVVRGPMTSQQTQIINGDVSFLYELSYDVVAEQEGTFSVGPVVAKKGRKEFKSNTLTITVKEGAKRENSVSQRAKESFQVEILTDKKKVYVGEPFVLLYRASWTGNIRDLNILQSPNFEGVLQKELDFDPEQSRKQEDGKMVTIYDFDKRLIIPNKPGTLSGQELKLTGRIQVPTGQRDFMGFPLSTFVQEVATAKIPAVQMLPLPQPKPASFSGSVGNMKITREISRKEVSGDESITITIRIEGTGNLNTVQVPELRKPGGFDVYDPKFDERISYTGKGVKGYKQLEYLLVPQFKGKFTLPAQEWSYFNTQTEEYETITLPEEELVVTSGMTPPNGQGGAVPPTSDKRKVEAIENDIRYLQDTEFHSYRDLPLKNITLLLGLILLGAWATQWVSITKKEPSQQQNWKHLYKEVHKAFAAQDEKKVAILIHALEKKLFVSGRFQIDHPNLRERFDEPTANALLQLYEKCQIAQYAPLSQPAEHELLQEFDALWNKI